MARSAAAWASAWVRVGRDARMAPPLAGQRHELRRPGRELAANAIRVTGVRRVRVGDRFWGYG